MNIHTESWARRGAFVLAVTLLAVVLGTAHASQAQTAVGLPQTGQVNAATVEQGVLHYDVYFSNGHFPYSLDSTHLYYLQAQQRVNYLHAIGFYAYIVHH